MRGGMQSPWYQQLRRHVELDPQGIHKGSPSSNHPPYALVQKKNVKCNSVLSVRWSGPIGLAAFYRMSQGVPPPLMVNVASRHVRPFLSQSQTVVSPDKSMDVCLCALLSTLKPPLLHLYTECALDIVYTLRAFCSSSVNNAVQMTQLS